MKTKRTMADFKTGMPILESEKSSMDMNSQIAYRLWAEG